MKRGTGELLEKKNWKLKVIRMDECITRGTVRIRWLRKGKVILGFP